MLIFVVGVVREKYVFQKNFFYTDSFHMSYCRSQADGCENAEGFL